MPMVSDKPLTPPTDFEMSHFIVYKGKHNVYSITNFKKESVSEGKKTILQTAENPDKQKVTLGNLHGW